MARRTRGSDRSPGPAPDGVEERPPREASSPAAVVGIGASAGGLDALKTLLAGVPPDGGLAWVVVLHLAPEHDSELAGLLQPYSPLPVRQVTATVPLEPDRVYVIPPAANLTAEGGRLRLEALEARPGDRAPIDHFFRSLAEVHGEAAVAVVLTGTGSDGAHGLRAVKERGGLVVVQEPEEAAHDGMPRSALSTGLVDLVLPLERVAPEVAVYARSRPASSGGGPGAETDAGAEVGGGRGPPPSWPSRDQLIGRILAQVRARTGRDLRRYRRATVQRRIGRRMRLRRVEELDAYLDLLREDPREAEALADALLVSVTRFFRDPEVYEALARAVVPELLEATDEEGGIRVWSVGCATGEEPYSLAMLLLEEAERRGAPPPPIKVFATDLHEPSLERAREGFYPAGIESNVEEGRLRRFFHQEPGGYRVRREVREQVLFARHDLLADPPYGRLDLVSCRDLLIYLRTDLQRKAADLFHVALRPGGFLALSPAERQDWGALFQPLDEGPALYRRGDLPASDRRLVFMGRAKPSRTPRRPPDGRGGPSAANVHQRMVQAFAPPSLLVSPAGRVVHLSERAGRYLLHGGGAPSRRVERLVRPELSAPLRAALRDARERGEPRSTRPVLVQLDGGERTVVVHVRPAGEDEEEGMALVLFEERPDEEVAFPAGEEAAGARAADAAPARIRRLEAELERARVEVLLLHDEHERTEEELRASNEELESSNEELCSSLEELETRGEELQSLNEELRSLAEENQEKAEELEVLHRDLERLLVATEIGVVFLDGQLRIVRYTPRIAHLFRVRPSDVGRPLTDLAPRLRYDELVDDARLALDRAEAVEREVEDDEGHSYLARLLPHWGPREDLDGVVAIFVDITTRKRMEQAEEESRVKSQFLSTMSHELRTPLNAVIGAADLMETEVLGELNDAQRSHMQRIKRSAWHLVRIIEEVLTFSRSEAGKERVKLEEVDVAEVTRDVVAMVRPTAVKGEIELTLAGADRPVRVRTDAGKLGQIAINLVGNAIKFAAARVEVALEERDDGLALTVRDDGPGIPGDRVEEIFEPFTQLDGSNTREKGGTGLGLTIARRQALLLAGEVRVQSVVGEGSTFTLWLPSGGPRQEAEDG